MAKEDEMILTSFESTGVTPQSRKHSDICNSFELKVPENALLIHNFQEFFR